MSATLANREIIRPKLHHFGLTTGNLEAMVDWYARVLGMAPNHRSSTPAGLQTAPGLNAAWVTNDGANHHIAILSPPDLTADPDRWKSSISEPTPASSRRTSRWTRGC